jgi:hypothetical protein
MAPTGQNLCGEVLYRARLWAGHAAFALDAMIELVSHKTPNYMMQRVDDNQSVQVGPAPAGPIRGEVACGSGICLRDGDELWQHQSTGEFVTPRTRSTCSSLPPSRSSRPARSRRPFTRSPVPPAFREDSPLERLFRDAHTMSQHALRRKLGYESAAKAILGRDNDWACFRL